MKKILVIICILLSTLIGCQSKEEISVIVPNGVPSIAQSYMEYNHDDHQFNIERVHGPQPLVAAFTSQSHDIIIAPVNLGANLYQKDIPYQLLGVLTWSNLQIISKTLINDIHDLSGKDIIAFGEGAVPQMIIDYLFENITLEKDANIQYTSSSAQESLMTFMQSDDSMAIVSEPVTSSARNSIEDLYVLDLADVWKEYTDEDLFPQAGVFVHKDLPLTIVEDYLTQINLSSEFANQNPTQVASYCESLNYPFEKSILEISIPKSQIHFQSIDYSKDAIESFLEMIYQYKPELIGNSMPDNDWYYPLS
ncbi:hypothetical protein KHQ88_01625 [Mycoplasmatota bacterium]|nr:hypothetical protein KHQ88_01625 [Mycoplasmatota bacterium]